MSFERGEIKYKNRARQLNDFSGLIRMRNITPTDIDGLIDYKGKFFIYLEGKVAGVEMPMGQRIALENVVKSHTCAKHPCIAILFEHDTKFYQDVSVCDCRVIKIFGELGKVFGWHDISDPDIDVLSIIDLFEREYKIA